MFVEMYKGEELGVCGAIQYAELDSPLYVRPSTGEILYRKFSLDNSYKIIENLILKDSMTVIDSNKIIQNLILKDAMTVIDSNLVYKNLLMRKYGINAVGIIFCNGYAMVINSDVSIEKRTLDKISEETGDYRFIWIDS